MIFENILRDKEAIAMISLFIGMGVEAVLHFWSKPLNTKNVISFLFGLIVGLGTGKTAGIVLGFWVGAIAAIGFYLFFLFLDYNLKRIGRISDAREKEKWMFGTTSFAIAVTLAAVLKGNVLCGLAISLAAGILAPFFHRFIWPYILCGCFTILFVFEKQDEDE